MFGREWSGLGRTRSRVLERGDLKYVILELLREKPRHGYEIIRALEERSRGAYAPSPGAVYPTLQMLEEMDYATCLMQDGKRVYSLTEGGRRFLEEQGPVLDGIRARLAEWWRPEVRDELKELMRELRDLGRVFSRSWRGPGLKPDQLRRIRAVIAEARSDMEAILAEAPGLGADNGPAAEPVGGDLHS